MRNKPANKPIVPVASEPIIPWNSKQLWHPLLSQHIGIKVVATRPVKNPTKPPRRIDKRIVVIKKNIFFVFDRPQ